MYWSRPIRIPKSGTILPRRGCPYIRQKAATGAKRTLTTPLGFASRVSRHTPTRARRVEAALRRRHGPTAVDGRRSGPEASRRACPLPQVIGCGWGGIDGPREILRQFSQAQEITQHLRPGLRPHIRIIPLTLMDRREGEAFRARREEAFDAGFGIAAGVTTVPAESGKPDCGQAVRCVTIEVGAIQPQALVTKARGKTASPPQRDQQMAFPKTQGAAGIENRRGRDRYPLAREIHAMLNLVAHEGKAALGGRHGIIAGELLGDPADPRVIPIDHGIHSQKGVMRLMSVHGVSYRR